MKRIKLFEEFTSNSSVSEKLEDKIHDFFKANPTPSDDEVHAFADELGVSPHDLETEIYKIVGKHITEGTNAEVYESMISEGKLQDFKKNAKDFFKALANESQETIEAFKRIYTAFKHGDKMSPSEKKEVGDQLKDVLKTIGLSAIAIMPGGIIVALIIKALKLQKHIIPSSFEYLLEE